MHCLGAVKSYIASGLSFVQQSQANINLKLDLKNYSKKEFANRPLPTFVTLVELLGLKDKTTSDFWAYSKEGALLIMNFIRRLHLVGMNMSYSRGAPLGVKKGRTILKLKLRYCGIHNSVQ